MSNVASRDLSESDVAKLPLDQPGDGDRTVDSPLDGGLPSLDNQDPKPGASLIPWRFKILAGSMILLFSFGSSFSETTLGPLKSTLIRELGITSESDGKDYSRCV